MKTIIIQSDNKASKLLLEIAKMMGAQAIEADNQDLIEYKTGLRLKKEKTGKLVSEESVMQKLKKIAGK